MLLPPGERRVAEVSELRWLACIAGMPAMQGGELGRRHTTDGAVRAHLVVVASPASDLLSSLVQRLEPLLVQALVAELAIEALDVGVLRGLACVVDQVSSAAVRRRRAMGQRDLRAAAPGAVMLGVNSSTSNVAAPCVTNGSRAIASSSARRSPDRARRSSRLVSALAGQTR